MKMLVKFWLQVCCCKQICEKIVLLFTWLSSDLKRGPSLSYIGAVYWFLHVIYLRMIIGKFYE